MVVVDGDEGRGNLGIMCYQDDRLRLEREKPLPPFSDPSKSEGWRGLYSISVYGRREKRGIPTLERYDGM
jgi:hypothetical protein